MIERFGDGRLGDDLGPFTQRLHLDLEIGYVGTMTSYPSPGSTPPSDPNFRRSSKARGSARSAGHWSSARSWCSFRWGLQPSSDPRAAVARPAGSSRGRPAHALHHLRVRPFPCVSPGSGRTGCGRWRVQTGSVARGAAAARRRGKGAGRASETSCASAGIRHRAGPQDRRDRRPRRGHCCAARSGLGRAQRRRFCHCPTPVERRAPRSPTSTG